jgi:hypothetical protein
MVRHVVGILQPVLGGERIGMGGPLSVAPLGAPASIAVLLAFSALLIAAAAAIFTVKELAGASGREG